MTTRTPIAQTSERQQTMTLAELRQRIEAIRAAETFGQRAPLHTALRHDLHKEGFDMRYTLDLRDFAVFLLETANEERRYS